MTRQEILDDMIAAATDRLGQTGEICLDDLAQYSFEPDQISILGGLAIARARQAFANASAEVPLFKHEGKDRP